MNKKKTKKVILVGIDFYGNPDVTESEAALSIEELSRLAETAHLEVTATVLQRKVRPENSTYIGKGKAAEIREFCFLQNVEIAIFDDELSGSQINNLESILDVAVIDRTMLILDIFALRAKSAEGCIQVELAQLQYRLPRLSGLGTSLSRLGGGIGTRGPGETKLESDRRHINRRIKHLKTQLQEVSKRRGLSRRKRKKGNIPTVALVGYTNAGKSSLMNVLCGSYIYTEDQLFATLDTTIRKLKYFGKEILFIDTVGFIRKLPHSLVEAFKSTLEESLNADLLLQVVDSSDSDAENQIRVTEELLTELKADSKPRFLIFNKSDKIPNINLSSSQHSIQELAMYARAKNIKVFHTSTVTKEGIDFLKESCINFFKNNN